MAEEQTENQLISPANKGADFSRAKHEARVIDEFFIPALKSDIVRASESNPDLKRAIEAFGDVSWYVLGKERLGQIKKSSPELYDELIDREESIGRLAESLAPNYNKEVWNSSTYVSRREARKIAEGTSPEARRNSRRDADLAARAAMMQITGDVIRIRGNRQTSFAQDYRLVNSAVEALFKEGLTIYDEPRQVSSLQEAAMHNLNAVELAKLESGKPYGLDINTAVKKQSLFTTKK